MTPPSGLIEQRVYEQRLTTVDAASGQVRQVSPADLYIYEYDWSPDGKSFVATAAHGAGDANWWVAQLCTIDIASGEIKFIYKPPLQIAQPRWSPDGKTIAFIGGIMSDEGSTGGDIYTIPPAAAKPATSRPASRLRRQRSPGSRPRRESCSQNKSTARAASPRLMLVRGKSKLSGAAPKPSPPEASGTLGYPLPTDGKTSRTGPPIVPATPGDLGRGDRSLEASHAPKRRVRPGWGKSESIHWQNDGMEIQGWLLYPANYDPSKRYPMVVSVHGGPGAAEKPSWPGPFFDLALLSQRRLFRLLPQSARQFRRGRSLHRGQRQGLRLRRFSRHSRGRRLCGENASGG